MGQLDAKEIKENIIKFIEEKGPSLPVNIAKRIGLNSLFTSAFLSELLREGLIKISHMKVGGSPLYYTEEKGQMLENFSSFLGSKEREAFELLKSKGFLQDDLQSPAIRIALRNLKDFAIPAKKEGRLFWKYFTLKDFQADLKKEESIKQEEPIRNIKDGNEKQKEVAIISEESKISIEQEELKNLRKELEEKNKEIEQIKQRLNKKFGKREKKAKKLEKEKKVVKDEAFLNEIKNYLAEKNIEFVNVEEFDKRQVTIKIKSKGKEEILFAYNKKKLTEKDIIAANKKASVLNIGYSILFRGELSKKFQELFDACKNLNSIRRLSEKHF